MADIWEITTPSAWFTELKGPQVIPTGRRIILLTLDELRQTPQETKLYNIFGQVISRADADADTDTRFGHLAFGPLL